MAFVVSAGELRAVERPTSPPVYAMRIGTDQYRDYAQLYRAQPELRTVIDFLARNIAQLGLQSFRRVSDVERVRLIDHPLPILLGKPNPSTTTYRMIDALVHDVCIFDNAYWLKVRMEGGGGPPRALRRVRPGRIRPTGDDWLEPEGYDIIGSRGKLSVSAESIVHFRGYNPNDDRLGSPPIESLRQILSEEWAANVYREQLWRNGARLSGYISRPADAPEWSAKAKDRFLDEWHAAYTGNSAQGGGTAMLEDGMTFMPAAVTPRDSQYIESRKLTREEVARSYHVPLPMVGILDHATFTNIKEQHKNLYQDCLGPWLENFQQEIELQLVPDLPDTDQVYVEFNFASKLNGSFEEQAAQLQSAVGGPYMTRNEARARLNLPLLNGGNELITPLNVTVGANPLLPPGLAPVEPKTRRPPVKARSEQHTTRVKDVLAAYFTRQGAAVLSQLGAEKARGSKASVDDVFDADRWNGELSADLLGPMTTLAVSAAHGTVTDLGGSTNEFDPTVMGAWLADHAAGTAKGINTGTVTALADALTGEAGEVIANVNALFDTYRTTRAEQLANMLVTTLSGFGTTEAGKHYGGASATKTWRTGDNPRPEHAAMDGETVPVDGVFSDGSRWPGGSGNADLDANCNCDVTVSVPA
jgi:HK97 family phage portal protein